MSKKSTSRTAKINGNKRNNNLRKLAKAQQQRAKSVSKLQHDTIEASKDMIKEAFHSQKQIASSFNVPVPAQVSEQIVKQSKEMMTNNFERATEINNQLGRSIQGAAIENTNVYSKTFDAYTDYNTNILNAWASYWGAQQQQFIRP